MANQDATSIIWGLREDMIAEYACHDWTLDGYRTPEECAYIITPHGPASYSEEYCATEQEAREIAKSMAESWGVTSITRL